MAASREQVSCPGTSRHRQCVNAPPKKLLDSSAVHNSCTYVKLMFILCCSGLGCLAQVCRVNSIYVYCKPVCCKHHSCPCYLARPLYTSIGGIVSGSSSLPSELLSDSDDDDVSASDELLSGSVPSSFVSNA